MRVPLHLPPALTSLGDFAFIDVETTGARPLEDRVTEIAIIRFHANGEQTRWQSLINPGVPIPAEIQALTGITNATTMLTDFSALQAYARYQFEIFLRTNTSGVADFVQSTVNLAPVYAPSSVLGIPLNDIAPSASLATAPASSATAVTVAWINNLNAAPVYDVQVVSQARNPQGATTGTFTLTAYDEHSSVASAYSLDVRPTSQAVAASSGFFPTLGSGVAGDFRQIAIWANQGRAIYQNLLRWDN